MADQRTVLAAELFKRAVDCPADQRPAFLEEACGDDEELRREVESLLKFDKNGNQFLDEAAMDIEIESLLQTALKADQRIGKYKLVSHIGSGGMGDVYLAHDVQLNRRVALKLVRFGIGGAETTRHFRREAQILASLNHRNIAQLYGAEITPDGFSFLVMEYVEGVRLDKYCDDNHSSIPDRLEVFRRVCGAVHYAHQRLVIHRDIKPANILITKEGQPKLLDFGIGKLLDSQTSIASEQTMTFAAAMTPEYASPEQVRGEAMTTASDIYSLGVLLYELLTGQRPYRISGRNPGEIARAIAEQEPARPSTALAQHDGNVKPQILNVKLLKGDLDNIVLKAMRKGPQRRYASVEQFSEDIRRHLADLPVIARPDTRSYRTAKFVQRHTVGVVMAAAVFLALAGGIVATLWQAHVAREQREMARAERARAQLEFNDVRKLATSFLFEFNNSIQNLPGATPARKLLVQRALEYLSKLAGQSRADADLQRELAEAYLKVGDLQGNPYEPNLGDTHGAEQSYEKAFGISTALVQTNAADSQARRYLARSYQSMGEVLPLLGKPDDGITDLRKAAEIFEKLVSSAPKDRTLRIQLADCYQSLGDLQGHGELQNLGDRVGALESYRKAVAIFDALAAEDGADQTAHRGAAILRTRIGDMQQAEGDLDGAEKNYRGALHRAQSLAATDPKNDRSQRILALSHRKLADLENQRGNFKQALQDALRALEINQALAKSDPNNAQAGNNYILSLTTVGELLNKSGDLDGSLAKYQQALRILEKLSAAAPADLFLRGQLSQTLITMGAVLADQGEIADARSVTSRGLVIALDLANRAAATPDELSQCALALLTCSPADLRDQATALQKAKQAVEKSGERDPKSLDIMAQAYFQAGDSARAIEAEKKAMSLLPVASPNHNVLPMMQKFETQLARFESSMGNP
jgi:serine/threonine protein kinase/tetratricopeptide (TPR) repeat protein